jgi:hypothetical protein
MDRPANRSRIGRKILIYEPEIRPAQKPPTIKIDFHLHQQIPAAFAASLQDP